MLESYAFYVVAAAAAIGLLGFFWLVARAFGTRVWWGLGVLFIPPLGALFIVRHFKRAVGPSMALCLAAVLAAAPYAVSYYERHFVPAKPFEQLVKGESRLTITGLKDFDYSTLQSKPGLVVLQMANPDVDDHTLTFLTSMDQLRTLDVSNSQITDEGLRTLAALPNLQDIYLARTHITDEGFKQHLAPKESLLKLDLTGTEIKGKTKRDWKNAKPDQREYVD
jgi:hypothetical protein